MSRYLDPRSNRTPCAWSGDQAVEQASQAKSSTTEITTGVLGNSLQVLHSVGARSSVYPNRMVDAIVAGVLASGTMKRAIIPNARCTLCPTGSRLAAHSMQVLAESPLAGVGMSLKSGIARQFIGYSAGRVSGRTPQAGISVELQ